MKEHLRRIRILGPNEVGGDAEHPPDDELWHDKDVVPLLVKRKKLAPDQQKKARTEAVRRRREQEKLEFQNLEERTLQAVAEGTMTEAERDDFLAERLSGYAQQQYKIKCLQRRLTAFQEGNIESTLLEDAAKKENELTATAKYYEHQYLSLSQNFSIVFNQLKYAQTGSYMRRQGFEWPTSPSSQAYFEIFAATFPWGDWPERPPTDDSDWRACCRYLHPDRGQGYVDAFGGEEGLTLISGLFNASAEIMKLERDAVEVPEEQREDIRRQAAIMHANEWNAARQKLCKVYTPKGTVVPLFLLAHWIDTAAGFAKVYQRRMKKEQKEQEAQRKQHEQQQDEQADCARQV